MIGVFGEDNDRLCGLLFAAIPGIGPPPAGACATALDGSSL
jgi:hypothetical protein